MAKVTIKDSNGDDNAQFQANEDEALGSQAQDAGAPIPFSCGVGACRTCICRVDKGIEHINKEAVSPMHIEVEENEILSCVAGLKAGAPEDAEIVLTPENL